MLNMSTFMIPLLKSSMLDTIRDIPIPMFMVVLSFMVPVTITIPGTGIIIIHDRLPGDLVSTGIHGQDGDFRMVSAMVGSVGVFTPTGAGGGRVVIVMDIDTAIIAVTGMVPGPVTEPVTGRAREVPHAMYTETGLPELEQEMLKDHSKPEARIREHGHRPNRTICIRIKREMFTRKIKVAAGIKNPIEKHHRERVKSLQLPKQKTK